MVIGYVLWCCDPRGLFHCSKVDWQNCWASFIRITSPWELMLRSFIQSPFLWVHLEVDRSLNMLTDSSGRQLQWFKFYIWSLVPIAFYITKPTNLSFCRILANSHRFGFDLICFKLVIKYLVVWNDSCLERCVSAVEESGIVIVPDAVYLRKVPVFLPLKAHFVLFFGYADN